MKTIKLKTAYKNIIEKLKKAKFDDYETDASLIFAHILQTNKLEFFLIEEITRKQYRKIKKFVKQRLKHIPVQYIIENVEFLNLTLYVNKNVLIPRFETELLADTLIREIKQVERELKVLDLCSGSGAIGLSVAKETKHSVKLSDISLKALSVAKYNAKLNEVETEFIKSNLFESIDEKFDIIVSNPPYIETSEIYRLMPEVRLYEPVMALDGGNDGFYFYKRIIPQAKQFLNKNGLIYLEFGINQELFIEELLRQNGYTDIKVFKDYNNINRFVKARLN